MPLPVSLSAYADLEPILEALISSGGLRLPRASLPSTSSPKPKARAENFRFRFYNYRKLLAQHGDPRADLAFAFIFDIDELGDLTIRPTPRPTEGITDLDGNPIDLSSLPRPAQASDISDEAAAFTRFLLEDDS